MWHLNIYNKTLYEEKGIWLCEAVPPYFCLEWVKSNLEAIRDEELAIKSYELPFDLPDLTYEMINRLSNAVTTSMILQEIENSVYGHKFSLFKNHFFNGSVKEYLYNYKCIVHLPVVDYAMMVRAMIDLGYLENDFLLNFFDFENFFKDHQKDFKIDELRSLGLQYLSIICGKIKNGEYQNYLNLAEVTNYLRNQFNVLETETGFFIDDRKLTAYFHEQLGRKKEFSNRFEKVLNDFELISETK